jgi:hypothetical protein
MAESRMNELAQELLSKSKADKVLWEDTGVKQGGSYRVYFPDVALTITRNTLGFEKDSDLRLELMSDAGRVIDCLETTPEDAIHADLAEIFRLAAQHVREIGINKALAYLKQK